MSEMILPLTEMSASLSPSEAHIYRYIIQNYERTSKMSIRQLSAAANASTASILRMVRKFGYPGYAEFRLEISRNKGREDVFFQDKRKFNLNTFFDITCQDSQYEHELDRAAAIIASCREILFVGDSYGACACEAGIHLFLTPYRITDYMMYRDPIFTRKPGTCAVVIIGTCGEDEGKQLYANLPIGKIPVIVIYCGGFRPDFPCNLITCRFDGDCTTSALSLIPAIHTLEELRKKVNSIA